MSGLILAAVAIIIGTVIFSGAVAPSVGTMTNTVSAPVTAYTMPAAGSYIDLVGQEYISGITVVNATNGTAVAATNYTIVEANSPTTGVKTIRMLSNGGSYAGSSVNVSYVYGAAGYVDDAGARGVVNMIPIMVALAILTGAFVGIKLDLFN